MSEPGCVCIRYKPCLFETIQVYLSCKHILILRLFRSFRGVTKVIQKVVHGELTITNRLTTNWKIHNLLLLKTTNLVPYPKNEPPPKSQQTLQNSTAQPFQYHETSNLIRAHALPCRASYRQGSKSSNSSLALDKHLLHHLLVLHLVPKV